MTKVSPTEPNQSLNLTEDTQDDDEENEEVKWIKENIKMRICSDYVPSNKEKDSICQCGYRKKHHASDQLKQKVTSSTTKLKSDFERNTIRAPTNAFGKIEFAGFGGNTAKFVRVDSKTDMSKILYLMIEVWRVEEPSMLISVTSGAKNFNIKPHLHDMLRLGLTKAARNTGAWIITDGFHASVAKHVGEAVKYSLLTNQEPVVVIGIAPWGVIKNRKALEDTKGSWPAHYNIGKNSNANERFLNPNHSHFILVDDGTYDQRGSEIEIRNELQWSECEDYGIDRVPVVLLVLEGGLDTLKTVKHALEKNTPVVIVKGSGGAADILAYAFKNAVFTEFNTEDDQGEDIKKTLKPEEEEDLKKEICNQMKKIKFCDVNDVDSNICLIIKCLEKSDLIHIFECGSGGKEIEYTMCEALLKANVNDLKEQLRMALDSNWIDFVKSELFTVDKISQLGSLDDVMLSAIQKNKVHFVELFLDHGVEIEMFLTSERLQQLYSDVSPKDTFKDLLTKMRSKEKKKKKKSNEAVTLMEVGNLIKDLLGDYYLEQYKGKDQKNEKGEKDEQREEGVEDQKNEDGEEDQKNEEGDKDQQFEEGVEDQKNEEGEEDQKNEEGDKDQQFEEGDKDQKNEKGEEDQKNEEGDKDQQFEEGVEDQKNEKGEEDQKNEEGDKDQQNNKVDKDQRNEEGEEDQNNEEGEGDQNSEEDGMEPPKKPDFENPHLHLLIWSVLNNYQDMAKLFWRKGKDAMAAALFAHALFSAMSDQIHDEKRNEEINANNREFMDLAMEILKRCHRTDEKKAQKLLIGNLLEWENVSCMLIAMKTKNYTFICETACMKYLSNIWMRDMTQENASWKLLICIAIPPLIPWLAKFKENEDSESASGDDTTDNESAAVDDTTSDTALESEETEAPCPDMSSQQSHPSLHLQETRDDSGDETNVVITCFNKVKKPFQCFYRAPVVIFFLHVISYMFFLGLYSYILISKFDQKLSVEEIVLIVWVFAILIEEIRQFYTTATMHKRTKLQSYIADGWNKADLLTIILFVSGMILKNIPYPQTFEAARILLGVNLVTFFMRLLHIFSVHRELGPKLVMIFRMVRHLISFFVIFLVFIVAYALASHAILFPNTELNLKSLRDIFRRPYWNIYGELMLEVIEGTNDCTNVEELYRNETLDRCPTESGKYFVPVLMGVYMLMCNILLLNLLISIFSNTYEEIQTNADMHWHIQQYRHIYEYLNRPFLVPPLSLIQQVWQLIQVILRKCCHCSKPGQKYEKEDYFVQPFEDEREELRVWEMEIVGMIINKNKPADLENIQDRVKTIDKRLDQLMKKIDEVQEQQQAGTATTEDAQSQPSQKVCQIDQQSSSGIQIYERLDQLLKKIDELQEQQQAGTATIEDAQLYPSQKVCQSEQQSSTVVEPGSAKLEERMVYMEKQVEFPENNQPNYTRPEDLAEPDRADEVDLHMHAVGVPIALLVLDGGPDTLETVEYALKKNTPAVIVKGSGRAADILAHAYKYAKAVEVDVTDKHGKMIRITEKHVNPTLQFDIHQKMRDIQFCGEPEITIHIQRIKDYLVKSDLIHIFEWDTGTGARNIGVAMFKALLRANKNQMIDQLKLALVWNRIDIVKSEIFADDKSWLSQGDGHVNDWIYSGILSYIFRNICNNSQEGFHTFFT